MTFLNLDIDRWIAIGISVIIVAAALIIGRLFVSLLLRRIIRPLVGRTDTTLDDTLLAAARGPLYWIVIVTALDISVARLDFVPDEWNKPVGDLIFVLYLLIGFVLIWRVVSGLFKWYGGQITKGSEMRLGEQLMPFFRRVGLIILSISVLIILLSRFNVDVSALVTTLGISSLAIALAAQAALEDTISGFIIMVDRPFRIGDRIEILDLGTWGDVIDIGLRSSRIRTRDNRTVIVPNSVIGRSLIVNHSFPDSVYRIQIHIGVAYGSDLELARQTIIEAVKDVRGVMPNRLVEALFLEFGDSAPHVSCALVD